MTYSQADGKQSDEELKRRVVDSLFAQNISDLRNVEVTADKGVVGIHGRVRTFHQRQLCIHCCQGVAGVRGIVDKIEVAVIGPALV